MVVRSSGHGGGAARFGAVRGGGPRPTHGGPVARSIPASFCWAPGAWRGRFVAAGSVAARQRSLRARPWAHRGTTVRPRRGWARARARRRRDPDRKRSQPLPRRPGGSSGDHGLWHGGILAVGRRHRRRVAHRGTGCAPKTATARRARARPPRRAGSVVLLRALPLPATRHSALGLARVALDVACARRREREDAAGSCLSSLGTTFRRRGHGR